MKYEFHVGDYVAYVANGKMYKGYVREYMHPAFSNVYCFVFQWDDGTQLGWSGNIQELPHNFVRIGLYDFTKKDEGKIEPLACETANDYSNEKLRKKINELVEAVNRLEEKVNGMAQS